MRSLDIKAPLFRYPGDQSDFVISKTLTIASKKEMFGSSGTDSSESSPEDDSVLMSRTHDGSHYKKWFILPSKLGLISRRHLVTPICGKNRPRACRKDHS